jgi:CcmD family protein
MSDLEYVALAYGVIWLGLLAYLIRISLRQDRLRSEIRFLEQLLEDPKPIIEDSDKLQPSLR